MYRITCLRTTVPGGIPTTVREHVHEQKIGKAKWHVIVARGPEAADDVLNLSPSSETLFQK